MAFVSRAGAWQCWRKGTQAAGIDVNAPWLSSVHDTGSLEDSLTYTGPAGRKVVVALLTAGGDWYAYLKSCVE